MHHCEFCLAEFQSRPQVKNPRACQRPECQLQRQRLNEREWRKRHPEPSGGRYHAIRREQRAQRIVALSITIRKCFQVGRDLLGLRFDVEEFSSFLDEMLFNLGVRRISKFWSFENGAQYSSLV